MSNLSVTVPLTPAYSSPNGEVVISASTIDISIPIQEGTHTFETDFKNVGTLKYFKDPNLLAAIRLTYTYNSDTGVIQLFGNDFESESESTCLITMPKGLSQTGEQHTYLLNQNPCKNNPNWNYTTPVTPGLEEAFSQCIRNANNDIINAAKKQFKGVCVREPTPKLDGGELPYHWIDMHCSNGTYLGTYDPNKEYEEGTTMTHVIESSFKGTVTFKQNEHIANVIGSSTDPKIASKPWIEIWERQFGVEDCCTSHNWAGGDRQAVKDFHDRGGCNDGYNGNDGSIKNIVGGHVILGQVAQRVAAGSDQVYIVPICKRHNSKDNIYMRAGVYTQGIWLENYLR